MPRHLPQPIGGVAFPRANSHAYGSADPERRFIPETLSADPQLGASQLAAAAPSPDGIAVQRQPTSPADPVSRPVDESGRRAILEEVQRASSQPPAGNRRKDFRRRLRERCSEHPVRPASSRRAKIPRGFTKLPPAASGPGGPPAFTWSRSRQPLVRMISAGARSHRLGRDSSCPRDGASAYAKGKQVAFAGTPSLRTVAHEAAHTVQQRAGVQPEGGVGRVGDPYEQQADRVADAVVAGRSAEPLLPAPPLDHHGQAASAPAPCSGWRARMPDPEESG